jgi:hypothetical protein
MVFFSSSKNDIGRKKTKKKDKKKKRTIAYIVARLSSPTYFKVIKEEKKTQP